MVDPRHRPHPEAQQHLEEQAHAIADGFWNGAALPAALKSSLHELSAEGAFIEELKRPDKPPSKIPMVHLAPAVLVRKRGDRSLIRVFTDIIAQLNSGGPLPIGVQRIVGIKDDHQTEGSAGSSAIGSGPQAGDVYFPLPANDAQFAIAHAITSRQGVLVQGPPGTGKSHTIVNLICHLLAHGERVLVTSHTARALRVLKSKFPGELSPLCVALVGDDLTAFQELQDAVQGMVSRQQAWKPSDSAARISHLEHEVDKARRAAAVALGRLRAAREQETHAHNLGFGDYRGSAQTVAERVRREATEFDWLDVAPSGGPPFSNLETSELLDLLHSISDSDRAQGSEFAPPWDQLMPPQTFRAMVEDECSGHAVWQQHESCATNHPAFQAAIHLAPEARSNIRAALMPGSSSATFGKQTRKRGWGGC